MQSRVHFGVLRFPAWWYTAGAAHAAGGLAASVSYYARSLAIGVWLRNLFVPMYGLNDWRSRVISFFVRAAQIVFRGIALFLWAVVCVIAFAVYLAVPPAGAALVVSAFAYGG